MNDIDTSSVAEVSMMILGSAEKRNRWYFTSKCDVFIAALRIALRLSSARSLLTFSWEENCHGGDPLK